MKKADLQNLVVLPEAEIEIPEWGFVTVRGLLLRDWLAVIERYKDNGSQQQLMLELVARCVFGDDGEPLFASADEVSALPAAQMPTVLRLVEIVQSLNGDVEEEEKN